jgi:hypothetical protein
MLTDIIYHLAVMKYSYRHILRARKNGPNIGKKPKAAYCCRLASFRGERLKFVKTAKHNLTGRSIQLNGGFERTVYADNRNKDTEEQSLIDRTGLSLQ